MKDKIFQIKLSHLIIGGIILLLFIFLLKCNINSPPINKYTKEKKEIDSLQIEISKLKDFNHKLGDKIFNQNKVMDSLNQEINNTQKEIINTRIYYGQKIKNINTASNSELEKFFTNRYK